MQQPGIKIGWAQGDITPEQPVLLRGLFHARVSEGVMDPLTVTAWALESAGEHVVLVSCDLVSISDVLRDAVRSNISERVTDLHPLKVIISATHTHTAPEVYEGFGMELGTMRIEDYIQYAAERIAETIESAWNLRTLGSLAYGMSYAVVGSNRRWVNDQGQAYMRGQLRSDVIDTFRHIEGYEDHSLNLVATYNEHRKLTGLIINVSSTAQLSENLFVISADWWHEARKVLREIYGEELFILPQCSAAGEITPFYYEAEANNRMFQLKGRTAREEYAQRIAHAVQDIVPFIVQTAESSLLLQHHATTLQVPANKLTREHAESAERDAERWQIEYEKELKKIEENPDLRNKSRWYTSVTNAYRRMNWNRRVVTRYEQQKENEQTVLPAEVHVLRLGDIVFATVPYELYLDFGIQMKIRSRAVQTFVVELTGAGTYLPSARSVTGGGYGSVPASNPVGPDGGQYIVEYIVDTIKQMFKD